MRQETGDRRQAGRRYMSLVPCPLSLRGLTVGIVGGGTMGEAFIKGLRAVGVSGARLIVSDVRVARLTALRRRYGVRVAHENAALVAAASVVILAVKPQEIDAVLYECAAARRTPSPLYLSIAAGVTLERLQRGLGRGAPVVRAMPNTAARIGAAITALAAGRGVSARQRRQASAICGALGDVIDVPERWLNAVTAVSGSGPAYFFTLVAAMREAGRRVGLPPSVAQRLAAATALGSGRLLVETGEDPATLIAQVASKRGTTEAALNVFARRGFNRIVAEAVAAATRRARKLATD